MPTPWLGWMIFGSVIIGFYLSIADSWLQPVAYDALAFASAGMVVVAILWSHVRPAMPWWLLALGITLMATGDVVWDILALRGEVAVPSWADLAYLPGTIAICIAAVLLLLRKGERLSSLLDAIIVSSAVGILLWVLVVAPHVPTPAMSVLHFVTVAAYPALDVVMLGILSVKFLSGRSLDLPKRLFATAVVALLVSDLAFTVVSVPGGYLPGVTDIGWLLGYVLFGAAALSLRSPSRQSKVRPRVAAAWAMLRPAVRITAVSLPLLAAVLSRAPDGHFDALVALVTGVIISVVVIIRLELSLRDKRTLLHERDRLEETMQRQISEDPLTQLPNRRGLADKLADALEEPERGAALLVLDIDDFKSVNDALGHQAGDEFLCAVALRLRLAIRSSDMVARYGGDEFAVVLTPCPSPDVATRMAGRLLDCLDGPIVTGRGRVVVSASIGVALSDLSGRSAENLLRDADLALYRAKAEGKHRWSLLDPEASAAALRSLSVARELPRALAAREFDLSFQPIVSLVDGGIESLEALLRWNHPTLGTLLPAEFLPAAERSIHMPAIDRWVLEEACSIAAGWRRLGAGDIGVNVNVSAAQIADSQYPETVLETLRRVGLAPGLLTLELLESSLDATPALMGTLEHLRESGVRISIDDFGTGFSSVSRVAELPVTELKVDRSVLAGAGQKRMASAVARMGQTLGLRLVAEGVETSDELNLVHSLGYDAAQGYLMSRPVSAAEVETMLRSQVSWRSGQESSPPATAANMLCGWLAPVPHPT